MDHPTSNNLASWFTKCRCPMCLGATCGERSIRLLEENDCCCVPLCCRDIGYTFLVLTHVVMEDPTSPKNTQHTTHMQPVSCPGTQRWGLRCCTASSAIWVATQVASSHGWFRWWRMTWLSAFVCRFLLENGMRTWKWKLPSLYYKKTCKSISCRSNSQRICLKSKAYLYNSKCVLTVHLCEKKAMGEQKLYVFWCVLLQPTRGFSSMCQWSMNKSYSKTTTFETQTSWKLYFQHPFPLWGWSHQDYPNFL